MVELIPTGPGRANRGFKDFASGGA